MADKKRVKNVTNHIPQPGSMTSPINFQPSQPAIHRQTTGKLDGNLTLTKTPTKTIHFPRRRLNVISVKSSANASSTSSEPSISSECIASVASPSVQITLTQRHFTVLNVAACAAFKRAAESLEKLLDVTREELPDTMAAVRLSGMEISDLTTELTELGQGITQGVRRSTNAVRMAEERLRHFANMTSRAPMQEIVNTQPTKAMPAVARSARNIRDGIVKGRTMLNMVSAISSFSAFVVNYFPKGTSKLPLNK